MDTSLHLEIRISTTTVAHPPLQSSPMRHPLPTIAQTFPMHGSDEGAAHDAPDERPWLMMLANLAPSLRKRYKVWTFPLNLVGGVGGGGVWLWWQSQPSSRS